MMAGTMKKMVVQDEDNTVTVVMGNSKKKDELITWVLATMYNPLLQRPNVLAN